MNLLPKPSTFSSEQSPQSPLSTQVHPHDFLWISTNETAPRIRGDQKARKKIKSYVMRRHRHFKKVENKPGNESKNRTKTVISEQPAGNDRKNKSRMFSIFLRDSKDLEAVSQQIDQQSQLPRMAAKSGQEKQGQYIRSCLASPTRTTIDDNISDPFNCLAIEQIQYLTHSAQAIKAINDSLNDPEKRYSDEVIAVVALLAAQAVCPSRKLWDYFAFESAF
jgi:hypothetical protein